MHITIESDGGPNSTVVRDDAGNEIPGIRHIQWDIEAGPNRARACIEFDMPGITAEAVTSIEDTNLEEIAARFGCKIVPK